VTFYCALSIETGVLIDFGLEGESLGIFLIFVNLAIVGLAIVYAWSKFREQRALKRERELKVI
jgi:mannose/fructose/N-acetylgalactosamine-specific phosphotransferase system component IID